MTKIDIFDKETYIFIFLRKMEAASTDTASSLILLIRFHPAVISDNCHRICLIITEDLLRQELFLPHFPHILQNS